jgi:Glucan phosphorylase
MHSCRTIVKQRRSSAGGSNEYIKNYRDYTGKALSECTILELYNAALDPDAGRLAGTGDTTAERRKFTIFSAEFLIGKLLSNNLINLGIYDDVKAELAEAGKDITELEEFEYEPSLGNGGLGRLAACFIDSLATLGLPADGVGLAYHCGLFNSPRGPQAAHET